MRRSGRTRVLALAGALAGAACMGGMGMHGGHGTAVQDRPPSPRAWDVVRLADNNPAATIVEVDLEARVADVELLDGKTTRMWTYNGSVPGPLLEANVGDEIVVHFTNNLPEETTIHWHGLRLPAAMDGVHAHVPVGGTFEYRFTARDAGTFWYHPHVRSEDQVRQGLYGSIVVHGPGDDALPAGRVVVLSDALMDDAGALQAPSTTMATQMLGVEGNFLLANGVVRPILDVRAGESQRLRLINAAPSRYFKLALPGHVLTLIGEDGGPLEQPVTISELLLVPGQRADVVIAATGEPGTTVDLQALPYDRGHASGGGSPANVLHLRYSAEPRTTTPALPTTLGMIPTLNGATTTRTIRLGESGGGHAGHGGGEMMSFTINGAQFPNVPLISGTLMTDEEWTVVNETMMDHPFHLHGFFFQVADIGGTAPQHKAWRDTVNVPANTTVRLRVRLDGFSGRWMYHCHILGHAERGMMGELQVDP